MRRRARALISIGLGQEAVAKRMGVDRAFVSSMERGLQNATLLTIWQIAQALGCGLRIGLMKKCPRFVLTFREPGRRPGERRTRLRVTAADPACRIGGGVPSGRVKPCNRCRMRGPLSHCALHQTLRFAFKFKPRILMGFAAGERRDALHEIKDALRLTVFLTENGFNDFRRLGL